MVLILNTKKLLSLFYWQVSLLCSSISIGKAYCSVTNAWLFTMQVLIMLGLHLQWFIDYSNEIDKERNLKVGILDFDYHQGDGSENIIHHLICMTKLFILLGKTSYSREKDLFWRNAIYVRNLKDMDIILYQAKGHQKHIDLSIRRIYQ